VTVHLILPAAGVGQRFAAGIPKQLVRIQDKTLLEWTLTAWQAIPVSGLKVLAIAADDAVSRALAAPFGDVEVIIGGPERADTVLAALHHLSLRADPEDWVMVHDIARPCLLAEDVERLLQRCQQTQVGGILARPLTDTIKQVDSQARVSTVDRSTLWAAQTPQCFRLAELMSALQQAAELGLAITDEASAIEAMGWPLNIVSGSERNIKLTHPADAALVDYFLKPHLTASNYRVLEPMIRIGHGYDVHRFDVDAPPCTIRLGGVEVPSEHPLLAHSDGDVVLHALCDALLGALALGDIGEHFPDSSATWRGADSRALLRQVYQLVLEQGYRLVNADITIAAQTPHLMAYKKAMQGCIADDLDTLIGTINVKATTTEKLGFIGRKEGIAVDAVCLVERPT
jgi:2-C-methyl-D-erythritol 4-phosphate cytidylyltransferase/2-C-methyl-D-erythritol 2,4-cyclodiphosphate synthase